MCRCVARGAAWIWLVAGLLLVGCRQLEPVVKIGLAAPFEGQHRALGYDVIYAARLAVRQVNEAGGVGGVRLALTALDDRGAPERAREVAATLAEDADVLIVVGHWLTATTEAALPVYVAAGLPLVRAGAPPLGPLPPGRLPAVYVAAYEAITPFDESPGPYAAAAHDAMALVVAALEQAAADGALTREGLAATLAGVEIDGMMGPVYAP